MSAKFPRIEMLELVKTAHATQFRNNGRVPYWMHLQAVAQILEWAFTGTLEVTDDELRDELYAAALGHDLYEDTNVKREDVVTRFGPRVDEWIQAMTNDGDDKDRKAYLARLAAGPEEARLIKLADLIENMASCAYAIPDMGIEWTCNFFLPLATETALMLYEAEFTTYRRTAGLLRQQMSFQSGQLRLNVAMFLSLTPRQPRPVPANPELPKPITAEEWAQALERTREREHAKLFLGGRPFAIPTHDDDWEPPAPDLPQIADVKTQGLSHDRIVSKVDELFASVDAENAAALAKAETDARATGKELFSLSRLELVYGEGSLAEREASLKLRYYVGHPEIRTLAEFVRHLREHEVWE